MPSAKHNSNAADLKRLFKVLGLSLLIVFVLIAAVMFLTRYTGLDLFSPKQQSTDVPDGVIFPVDADTVKDLAPYENGIVMLTNAAVRYLDSSGREICTNKHTFASPEMQIKGKTVFAYDKGGRGYRIEKNASVYAEQTADGAITCGAVGKKDNYAFSLDNHGGYQSHIFVYSFRGEKQFEWGSASDYCFRLALSDSGNKLAVCVLGVENAEYYSKVMVFSFNSGQPAYTVDFPGKTVFGLDFISGKRIAVYTDSGAYVIESDGKYHAIQEYAASELQQAFVSSHGLSCTAIAPYGNEQTPLITVFDERHNMLYSHSYHELVSDVVCGGSYTGVVMYDHVQILNSDDKVLGDILPSEACERCVIANHSLFILTASGLHRYSIYFDTEKTSSAERETTVPDAQKQLSTATEAAMPEEATADTTEISDTLPEQNDTEDVEQETDAVEGSDTDMADDTDEPLFG